MLIDAHHPRLVPQVALDFAQAIVALYQPRTLEQKLLQERVLAFTAEHADALLRSCEPGHLTGSAFVVNDAGDQALLMAHKKLERWLQPGGHADGNANLAAVALQEATEETGIAGLRVFATPVDIDIHRIESPKEPAHDHLDVRFLVVAPPNATAVANHESDGLAWVPLDDLTNPRWDLDTGTLRLATSAMSAFHELRQS